MHYNSLTISYHTKLNQTQPKAMHVMHNDDFLCCLCLEMDHCAAVVEVLHLGKEGEGEPE
jgi:hypothetical protein